MRKVKTFCTGCDHLHLFYTSTKMCELDEGITLISASEKFDHHFCRGEYFICGVIIWIFIHTPIPHFGYRWCDFSVSPSYSLTHWGRVIKPDHHLFRQWLGAWPATSHYLNQCWDFVNWTLRNKLSEYLIKLYTFEFKKMHFKMSSGKWRPFCLSLNVLNSRALLMARKLCITSYMDIHM